MGANDNINKYSGYLSDAQRRRIKKQFEDLRRSGADEARTLEVKSTQDYTAGRNQLANLGLSANPPARTEWRGKPSWSKAQYRCR